MRFTTLNLIGLVVVLGVTSACTDEEAKLRADIGKTACQATTKQPLGTIVTVERDPSGQTSAIAYVVQRDGQRRGPTVDSASRGWRLPIAA